MQVKHELIADIPLITGFCERIGLQDILNRHISTHGHQKGLSNSHLTIGWIAHILTQSNHCKSPVKEWANKHKMTFQAIFGKAISDNDFDDCQLGRLLFKFADDSVWHALEESFYKDAFTILGLDTSAPNDFQEDSSVSGITSTIKLDATTTYGYHEVKENGIMQRGFSKDHRPDLPQLKIMVSVEGNTGIQVASNVVPGNMNDDILYIPLLERTRKQLNTSKCLICGDCKMSSLGIRSNIVRNNEFYLTPLQLFGKAKELFDELVDQAVNQDQTAELIIDINDKGEKRIIGAGYEINRKLSSLEREDEERIEWNERVLLIRSFDHVNEEIMRYKNKIKKWKTDLCDIKSKLFDTEEKAKAELLEKIEKFEQNNEKGLFKYKIKIECELKERKRGELRNGKVRKGTFNIKKYRGVVVEVKENSEAINVIVRKLGWRLYVTNADKSILKFSMAYKFFRKTMYVIEIGFHVLKDYINISPLFVRKEEQILGMTRLLMLALKILTLMTAEIRANMKKEGVVLKGLYAGQEARLHTAPTAQSLLKYFSRQDIAIIGHEIRNEWHWIMSPLNELCVEILRLLKIPESGYTGLPTKLKIMGYEK